MPETTLFKSLLHRRVPQILGLYLAAAWIAIEFSNLIVDRYSLSQTLVDFLLVLLASFVPTVLMLAWFHGAPGRDEWTRVEKIGIPANVIGSMALLAMLFQGEQLGATTTTVTVIDEQGQQVERVMAKPELRKRLAIFFLDNQSGDPDLDWLQYGLPVAVATDLGQSMFVHVWTPYREYESRGFADFQKAGFPDGLDVPMALMKAIAQKKRREFFITGTFDRRGDEYTLQLDVYRTGNAAVEFSGRASGSDILLLADRLSNEIAAALDLPQDASGARLGIADRAAHSTTALEFAVLGMSAEHLDNDLEKAVEYWQQAVELDPGFAMVHMMMAHAIFQLGDLQGASDAIRKAVQHDYQLTEDNRFIAKALHYSLRGEPDKTLKLFEMWVELYPENTLARKYLAAAYSQQADRPEDALAQLQIAYRLDPGDDSMLLPMARLHELLDDIDAAIAAYARYAEENPDDQTALVEMADTLANAGQLEAAAQRYERASLLAPELVAPIVGLAEIAVREGRYPDARRHLTDAEAIVRIPQQQGKVIRGWIDYHYSRGQIGKVLDLVDRLYEVEKAYRKPINLLMLTYAHYADAYALAGQAERGLEALSRLQSNFEPPLDGLADVGLMMLWLAAGDIEKGREYTQRVDEFLRMFNQEEHYYAVAMGRGRLAELEGDLEQAIAFEREALELFSRSLASTHEDSDRMRIRLSLANFLIRADRLDEAQTVLDGALLGHPAHPLANLELARLQRARGNMREARDALRIALDAYADADDVYPPAVAARRLEAELLRAG
jgi:tetratricopeptide (TPR) repeat protein